MKNNRTEEIAFPRLYTLHSQKGGVGKTSIALAIAGFAAIFHNKKTLIIDADLTGSSLEDILGWSRKHKIKYFNELILANPRDFDNYTNLIPKNLQQVSNNIINEFGRELSNYNNKLSYLSSSPYFPDIHKIIPLITQEDHLHFIRNRLEDIVGRLLSESFDVIIIDHPPGLYGVSKASLNLILNQTIGGSKTRLDIICKTAIDKELTTQALLITTSDPADYLASVPSLSWIIEHENCDPNKTFIEKMQEASDSGEDILIPIDLILNKVMIAKGRGAFDPVFAFLEMISELEKDNFLDGRSVHPIISRHLRARAKKLGALAARNITTFKIDKILETIEKLYNQKPLDIDYMDMEDWCREVGKSVGLYSDKLASQGDKTHGQP